MTRKRYRWNKRKCAANVLRLIAGGAAMYITAAGILTLMLGPGLFWPL